jgi:hypothetical protein
VVCCLSNVWVCTNVAYGTGITLFKDRSITFVPRQLHDLLKDINPKTNDIISKCSWVRKSHISIESKMLKICGGMFGVMSYYHASIVHHKKGVAVTNHLLLKTAMVWRISQQTESNLIPDFCMLIQQFSQFTGHSLVTVSHPHNLFVAIAHAALGVYIYVSTSSVNLRSCRIL